MSSKFASSDFKQTLTALPPIHLTQRNDGPGRMVTFEQREQTKKWLGGVVLAIVIAVYGLRARSTKT